jgi:hypothetical protein
MCGQRLAEEVSWLGVVGRRRLPGFSASGADAVGLAAHSCGGSAGLVAPATSPASLISAGGDSSAAAGLGPALYATAAGPEHAILQNNPMHQKIVIIFP